MEAVAKGLFREMTINADKVIGKEVIYQGQKVGHIIGIDCNGVKMVIDSDIVASRIRGNKATISVEVSDR